MEVKDGERERWRKDRKEKKGIKEKNINER